MLGFLVGGKWKTEMGECKLVAPNFYDDANVDSDVDLNEFEGEVCWNKSKQQYVYNFDCIT